MFSVRIQIEPISRAVQADDGHERCGAEVRFIGKVRNDPKDAALGHLVLEHFPGVTESEIERIIGLARERWALQKAQVVHRVGRINVGEDIVMVETASAHRKDAYAANVFIMDYLKTEAPFWKQECFVDGSAHWVEAKDSDQHAAQRWADATGAPVSGSSDGHPLTHAAKPALSVSSEAQNIAGVRKRRIGALILAGGEGSRMGYVNKGLQPFRGRPLVQHVADTLAPHVDYLAVSANNDVSDYQTLGFQVFTDDPSFEVRGPLAGIVSALPRFPDDLDAVLVAPCDTPLLPADLVPRLADALFAPQGPRAVVAATPESTHHILFMCRPGMLASLAPHLLGVGRSDYSLRAWLQACGYERVHFEDERAFANINDLKSLQALQA